MLQQSVPIEESSAVAEARRRASAMAQHLSFGDTARSKLELAVTELATNVVHHARSGQILLRPLAEERRAGIEVLALDKGPGMSNVTESMRDGHSTRTTPGLGLGSVSRLTNGFEVFSQPGRGTVARFESWADDRPSSAPPSIDIGGVCLPKPGEDAVGDSWAFHATHNRCEVVVADGLGHGPEAATASQSACRTAMASFARTPVQQIEDIHAALRPTRGAAAAVVVLDIAKGVGIFCGVGNIAASARSDDRSRSLVSHNGILGSNMRKVQEFQFPFVPGALLILHSDGLTTHWDLSAYPGLASRHPAVIAAVLFRDHQRGNDDATVVVARHRVSSSTH